MNTINEFAYYSDIVIAWVTFYITFLWEHFRDFAFVIKIAVLSLTLSGILVLGFFVRLLENAHKENRWKKAMDRLEEKWGEAISYILSDEAKTNMSRKEILDKFELSPDDDNREQLKSFKEKFCFCRILYQHRISAEAALGRQRNLQTVLDIFGLKDFLENVINKSKLKHQVEALHMMRAFKVSINSWLINQMMESKRRRVKRLAMYASIMSNSNTDLEYFETKFFDQNCCTYDEMQLGFVLSRRLSVNRPIPNLTHWIYLNTKSQTQCIFVRLMRQFDQAEYCADLVPLFRETNNRRLIEEISRTWGYLHYTDCEQELSELLVSQPDTTKIVIMHALSRLGTGNATDVFIDHYTSSGSQLVRLEALRCLWNYGDEGKAKVKELEQSAPAVDAPLFAFFHNDITREDLELPEDDIYQPLYGDNLYSVG